jgi:tRNA modification GTPase
MDEFGSGMTEILKNMTGSGENVLATNERQRRLLSECINHLQTFLGIPHPTPFDKDDSTRDIVMGAEELKYAANALGKISGKVDPEEVLGIQPLISHFNKSRSNIR